MYIFLLSSLAFVSANYSIDISGLKQSYSVGEEISYTVILLEDGKAIDRTVQVTFSDDFGKSKIVNSVLSNSLSKLLVNESFASFGWHVQAAYNGKEVSRSFAILEKSSIEFSLEGDKLIIKNSGNVPYTKEVKIKIGQEESTYTQNIPVGGQNSWILVAPKGTYNIEVSDGINVFTKSNVNLDSQSTGNAIGVMSDEFKGTGFASGVRDPNNLDKTFISMDKLPVALVFVSVVLILIALLYIKKKYTYSRNTSKKK